MSLHNREWKSWLPGVLSNRQLGLLVNEGHIDGVTTPKDAIGTSWIDLHLSAEGYRLTAGAVKPFGPRFLHEIKAMQLVEKLRPTDDGTFTLEPKQTYLFKLNESLRDLAGSSFYGQSTARSSVGRVDVLARLVVDGMDTYETFNPEAVNSAGPVEMYVEVTPMTFRVRVKPGISLTQLRLFHGALEISEIACNEVYECCLHADGELRGATLSANLDPETIVSTRVVAFCASEDSDSQRSPIDLWSRPEGGAYPCASWKFVQVGRERRLTIRKGRFYILRSKELVSLPGGVAVYCRATDEEIGEMRIHYAGFVHPLFGLHRKDKQPGTPLIFEVRGHDLDVSLRDGETMARLKFYRMSEPAQDSGKPGKYGEQTLQLSSFFGHWPKGLVVSEDGTVCAPRVSE
jgi:dCTP deaminase